MSFKKHLFLTLVISLQSLWSFSQEHYPIHNFTPNTYNGELQNWGIAQDNEKNMYFANNGGLLKYNGASWQLYPSPNGSILRSVNVRDSIIYTGCYREFGYWKKTKNNSLQYYSLSNQVKDAFLEDEEIWKILFFDKWIIFQSLRTMFIYDENKKTFSKISSKTHLPKVFKVNQSLYFQKLQEGLFRLENGESTLVSEHPIFKNDIIVNIFSEQGTLLIQTQEKGFFTLKDASTLKEWQTESSEIINNLNVYSSIRLDDGSFILGTVSKGIYHLSKKGKIITHLNQEKGLQNNTILSIFQDVDKNLWFGLDNGISMIDIQSPFRVYKDTSGRLGAIYATIVFDDKYYVGTNQGLFYKELSSQQEYKPVKGIKGQVWCLKIIDGKLFCGHNSGTFIIKNHQSKKICAKLGTWNIQQLKTHPNLLIQGNYEGLHILEKNGTTWKHRNKIEGFNISSRFIELLDDTNLIVSHEHKGVMHLELSDDFLTVKNIRKEDVPKSSKVGIIKHNNNILYFAKQGVYIFNRLKNRFVKDSLYTSSILSSNTYVSGKMLSLSDHSLWAFTKENIIKITPSSFNKAPNFLKIPLPIFIRKDIMGYENLHHLKGNIYLMGTSEGYLEFDLDKIKNKKFTISIDQISCNKANNLTTNYLCINKEKNEIQKNTNNLYFSFYTSCYSDFFETSYQYKLEGLYENWSKWDKKPSISFKNLPSGKYMFKVRAKIGNNISQNTATYSFKILKPWHLNNLMIVLYIVLFIALFLLLNRWYKKREEHLKREKEKELAVLQLENEKMVVKLTNDKLESEVKIKNRELATSAMNLMNKSELLITIKDKLKNEANNDHVKSVLKIINENLEENNQWEVFQEAFNNTDQDFLKKLKQLHPKLTNNDLKLCVYLRINLSSKEIAPLLNISLRSVEIKRYRLRKKMSLERNQKLIDYILSI